MKKTLRGKLAVAIATAGILSTMAVTVAGASATLNGDLTFTSSDGANSLAPATAARGPSTGTSCWTARCST